MIEQKHSKFIENKMVHSGNANNILPEHEAIKTNQSQELIRKLDESIRTTPPESPAKDTERNGRQTVDVGSDARHIYISEESEEDDQEASIGKELTTGGVRKQGSTIFSVDGNNVSVGSKKPRYLKSSARTIKDIKDPSLARSVAELSSEVDRLLAKNPSTKRIKAETCDKESQIEQSDGLAFALGDLGEAGGCE